MYRFYILVVFWGSVVIGSEGVHAQVLDDLEFRRGTFLGAADNNGTISHITVDAQGNIYGIGSGTSFPTTAGAYKTTPSGPSDIVVFKMNPDMSRLIWSTYVGGSNGYDIPYSIAVNAQGEVYITGFTKCSDFPITVGTNLCSGAWTNPPADTAAIFVLKLRSDGSGLVYSRILGYTNTLVTGGFHRYAHLALNPQGEAFVYTSVAGTLVDVPPYSITANAYQSSRGSTAYDLVLTKLSTDGSILYSTYIGGSGADYCGDLCYANGKVYCYAATNSPNFPLLPSGSGMRYCVFIGDDNGTVVNMRPAFLLGSGNGLFSGDIVYDAHANRVCCLWQQYMNLSTLDTALSQRISDQQYFSTPNVRNISVGNDSKIYITDVSATMTTTPNAFMTNPQGLGDINLMVLDSSGTQLRYATYLGGNSSENCPSEALAIGEGCSFRLIVGGYTSSSNFPTTTNTYQPLKLNVNYQPVLSMFAYKQRDTLTFATTIKCGEIKCQVKTGPCRPIAYLWTFGDGTPMQRAGDTLTHLYTKGGTYIVAARVLQSEGDTTYVEKNITVFIGPQILAAPHSIYTCSKDTGVALSVTGGVRYSWTPKEGLSDTSIANPIATPAKNTTYYVRGWDANGCFSDDSVNITVIPVTAVASKDTIVCTGSSVTLKAAGGASISWLPKDGLNKTTGKEVIATPKATTTYTVVVTDGSCSDTAYVRVTVSNKPKVVTIPTPIVCTGGSAELGITLISTEYIDTLGCTYSWLPSATLSNPSQRNPIATPSKSTRYYCTVTNAYGCTTRDSMEVRVQSSLDLKLSADTSVCVGSSFRLQAGGGARYFWSPKDGLDDSTTATPLCTPNKKTTYTVITTSGTCADTAQMTVDVFVLEKVIAKGGGVRVCKGTDVELHVSNYNSSLEYEWRDEEGTIIGKGEKLTVRADTTSRYYVRASNGSCETWDTTAAIEVNNTLSVEAKGEITVCTGTAVELSIVNYQPSVHYEWMDTSGQLVGTGEKVTVTPFQTTTYIVHAQQSGCEGWDTLQVRVNTSIGVEASEDKGVCRGESAELTVLNGQTLIQYEWKEENGMVVGMGEKLRITATQTTRYIVHGTANGCEGWDTVSVTVHALPTVKAMGGMICEGENAELVISNVDVSNTYTWKDEKGSVIGSGEKLSVSPAQSTRYIVEAKNEYGCLTWDTTDVVVESKTRIKLSLTILKPDNVSAGDSVTIRVMAEANRAVHIDNLSYNLRSTAAMLSIEGATYDAKECVLKYSGVQDLSPTAKEIVMVRAMVLVSSERSGEVRLSDITTSLPSSCIETDSIQAGTALETDEVCANILRNIRLGAFFSILPNPVSDEVRIESDYAISELRMVSSMGEDVDIDSRTFFGKSSLRVGVHDYAAGLYYIRARLAGSAQWITKTVVIVH